MGDTTRSSHYCFMTTPCRVPYSQWSQPFCLIASCRIATRKYLLTSLPVCWTGTFHTIGPTMRLLPQSSRLRCTTKRWGCVVKLRHSPIVRTVCIYYFLMLGNSSPYPLRLSSIFNQRPSSNAKNPSEANNSMGTV